MTLSTINHVQYGARVHALNYGVSMSPNENHTLLLVRKIYLPDGQIYKTLYVLIQRIILLVYIVITHADIFIQY